MEIKKEIKREEPTTEMAVCRRCGRKLKNPEAIKIGMGTTCYRKFLRENNHKKLF